MPNKDIFKERAKTFFWASLFFTKKKQKEVETLYLFCRYIDDLGDSDSETFQTKKKKLEKVKFQLLSKISENPTILNFLNLSKNYNIKLEVPLHLIDGVLSDQKPVNILKFEDLVLYCYRVAGTVGLMMCSIMGVKNKKLFNHAIELGVAMQLTNISRDIREDLDRKRIYLPKKFRNFQIKKRNVSLNKKQKEVFASDICKLIDQSNELYEQARIGIFKLPFKYRLVILIASNLYQRIGYEIAKDPRELWNRRIYVNLISKINITLISILYSMFGLFFRKKNVEKFPLNNILIKYGIKF